MSEDSKSPDTWLRTILHGAAGPALGAVVAAILGGAGLFFGPFTIERDGGTEQPGAEPVRTVTVTVPGPTVTVSAPESADPDEANPNNAESPGGQSIATNLTDLVPLSDYPNSGSATINGVHYPSSIFADINTCEYNRMRFEYSLGREYSTLSAVAGIDDEAFDSTVEVLFKVIGDDKELFRGEATYGEPVEIDEEQVEGVLRLALEYQVISHSKPGCGVTVGRAVFGDPQLRK